MTDQDTLKQMSNERLAGHYEDQMILYCWTHLGTNKKMVSVHGLTNARLEVIRRLDPEAMVARVAQAFDGEASYFEDDDEGNRPWMYVSDALEAVAAAIRGTQG